jgi:putative transcriptional regulator
MGVKFSELKTFVSTANALGSNMFKGYKPTPKGIEIIRDYVTGKISLKELVAFAKKKPMSNSYIYIDTDYSYTDPKTGLLRNLQDITDPDVRYIQLWSNIQVLINHRFVATFG